MPTNNTLLEDLLALGGSLLGNLSDVRHEFKAQAKGRVSDLARHLDLVSRDEFDTAFAMLAKARKMQEDLNDRLAALESKFRTGKKASVKPMKSVKVNLPSVKKDKQRKKRA